MSTLLPAIPGANHMTLSPTGMREGYDTGYPQTSATEIFSDGKTHVGIWECTPGGWSIENRSDTETCSIISGRGVITDADGTQHILVPGSVIVLPKGWSGRWDISETLRKLYIIVE